MKQPTYTVLEPVHGATGSTSYAYEAGEVTPKGADEKQVLDQLVAAGLAETKKKG